MARWTELDEEERAPLHQLIDAGIAEADRGRMISVKARGLFREELQVALA